jgi:hypothetical protein
MQAGGMQGRMFARLQVGSGLWLFVRWPQRLVPLPHDARTEPADARSSIGDAAISEKASQLLHGQAQGEHHGERPNEHPGEHPGEHRSGHHDEKCKDAPCTTREGTGGGACRSASERWLHGCEQILLQGVELEVLGVWG